MLVLDANILIRAMLGSRVLGLLRKYAGQVELMAPDLVFQEAQEHLPGILQARKIPVAPAMATLDLLPALVQIVEAETYASFESIARKRLDRRDEDDWPVLAAALALGCPIWTEDTDFFGCGVATWTTDRVELFLAKVAEREAWRFWGIRARWRRRGPPPASCQTRSRAFMPWTRRRRERWKISRRAISR